MVVALAHPPLRPYQAEAAANIEAAWRSGIRATMIEHGTGSGKTTLFSEMARRAVARGERVLVFAHRKELVDQAAARLRLFGLRVGVERGASRAGNAPVVVTSVQTMSRRMTQWAPDTFDLLIADETHHAASASWRRVIEYFKAGGARLLGVTATSDRADQVSLRTVFESCAHRYGVVEAVHAGFLVPVRGVRVEVPGMDLSAVRRRTRPTSALPGVAREDQATFSDLHPGDLGRAMIAPSVVEGVTGPLLELAGDRRTVVFAVDVAHAQAIVTSLNTRREGCARWVAGISSDRQEILAAFAAGEFQFLVNCVLLTEGWDMPSVACVALARPTQSRIFVAQACGRGLRPHPSKQDCLVIDFTTSTSRFTLIGPEDVLAGAMIEPPVATGGKSTPVEVAPYVAKGRVARFRLAAVELLRRAGRAVERRVPRTVGAGRRAVHFLARMATWLIR